MIRKKNKKSMNIFLLILLFLLISTIFYNNNDNNISKKKDNEYLNKIPSNLKSSLYSFSLSEIISSESVNHSSIPFILMDDFENIHIAWRDITDLNGSGYNDLDIFYKRWDNNTQEWTSTEIISNESTNNSFSTSMAIDSLGDVHIVWDDLSNITAINNDNEKSDIYYKYLNYTTGLWSSIELISTESNQSAVEPSMVIDSQDNIHVVWFDITDFDGTYDYDIFYKRWNATSKSWTITEVISNESTQPSQNPQITIDKYDNIHIVWDDWEDYNGCGSDADIFYKKWNNNTKTWSNIEIISNESSYFSQYPKIVVGDTGNLHITWEDKTDYNGCGSDTDIFYKKWDNNTKTWSNVEIISNGSTQNSYYPSITLDNLENVYIVWEDSTNLDYSGEDRDIFYRLLNTTSETWSSTNLISSESTELSAAASITADKFGTVCVVWQDRTDYNGAGSDYDIFYKHLIINDRPMILSTPNNIFTNGTVTGIINWMISDQIGGTGEYRIIINDIENNFYEWIPWTQWNNNILLNVPIKPSDPGIYVYTIEYYDIYHQRGLNSSVIVTINDDIPIIEGPNDHEVYKGTRYLLSWIISDDFGGISYRFYENDIPKSWRIWLNSDPIPYILDTSVLGTFNITIEYNTTTGQIGFDTVLIKITRSPFDIFIQDYLTFLLVLIAVLIGISIYIILKKSKKVKKVTVWKEKTEVLFDTLNIDSLLIIHKETSTVILNLNYFKIVEEPSLIGGFIQAITSFKYVLKEQKIKKPSKELFLLDFREYKILIEDGEFIRIALIINLMPSDYIMSASKGFIEEFESKFYKYLKNFSGEISVFQNSMDLIDKYFNIHLVHPHIINENPPSVQLTSFQEKILKLAKKYYSLTGNFYLTKLLEFLILRIPHEPKDKISANLSDLIQYGYINQIIRDS